MSDKPKYRIRGLTDFSGPSKSPGIVQQPVPESMPIDVPAKSKIPWPKATQAVGKPHLRDHLYGFNTLELGKLWPTFSFLRPRMHRAIKTVPLALDPYLFPGSDDQDVKDILNEAEDQNKEAKHLKKLVEQFHANEEPDNCDRPPIANAFAATLFSGSRWFKKNREKIFLSVRHHSVAAYVALLSGVWQAEKGRLLEVLSSDSSLLLDYWRSAPPGDSFDLAIVREALGAAPHLHSLTAHANVPITGDEAWSNLCNAAEEDAMAAAFALGLQPIHPKTEQWKRLIKSNPRAMYWAVRVGGCGEDRTQLPYWRQFREQVMSDPRWGYHWCRDFEAGSAYEFAWRHWPNHWAVEMVVDLRLAKDWVVQQHEAMNIEPPIKDEYLQAIVLWAANYTLDANEND